MRSSQTPHCMIAAWRMHTTTACNKKWHMGYWHVCQTVEKQSSAWPMYSLAQLSEDWSSVHCYFVCFIFCCLLLHRYIVILYVLSFVTYCYYIAVWPVLENMAARSHLNCLFSCMHLRQLWCGMMLCFAAVASRRSRIKLGYGYTQLGCILLQRCLSTGVIQVPAYVLYNTQHEWRLSAS